MPVEERGDAAKLRGRVIELEAKASSLEADRVRDVGLGVHGFGIGVGCAFLLFVARGECHRVCTVEQFSGSFLMSVLRLFPDVSSQALS